MTSRMNQEYLTLQCPMLECGGLAIWSREEKKTFPDKDGYTRNIFQCPDCGTQIIEANFPVPIDIVRNEER